VRSCTVCSSLVAAKVWLSDGDLQVAALRLVVVFVVGPLEATFPSTWTRAS